MLGADFVVRVPRNRPAGGQPCRRGPLFCRVLPVPPPEVLVLPRKFTPGGTRHRFAGRRWLWCRAGRSAEGRS